MGKTVNTDLLTTYWFECEIGLGVGVTAFSFEDAVNLLQNDSTLGCFNPSFERFKANVQISDLDVNHVIPNMGVMQFRGIWYPNVS
jgi:hypothetical protein